MSFRGAATICSPPSWPRRVGASRCSPFASPAQRPVPRDARLLRALAHRHRRLARPVGVDNGENWLAAEAVFLAAERPPERLRHRLVATLICIGYSLRLWSHRLRPRRDRRLRVGVALGWSKPFAYWGMPILKLIGPVPATAWIPCTFYFFPTTFDASVFIVALSSGIPIAILTSSGVASVNRAYYDVGRNLGARQWYLVSRIAVPASLPHIFVGLFMALYYSFAVLVVAEMLGAKYGLGWYIQFQTNYSGYANVYATLVIMALICAGIVKLLFVARDRLLGWQEGFI